MTRSSALRVVLLVTVGVVAGGRVALAEGEPACPTGSLLAGAQPHETHEAYHWEHMTDGVVAVDGADWMSDVNTLLAPGGDITYRLEAALRVRYLVLQADGNDDYVVSGSLDGQGWQPVWHVPAVGAAGMRTRFDDGIDVVARFLRVSVARGDGAQAIGELAAYCQRPDPWPPAFRAKKGVVRDPAWQAARKRRLAWGKVVLAAGMGLALGFLARSRERGRQAPAWVERGIYGVLVLASGLAWTNFGSFHGPNVLHPHEMFHHVLGAKYFEENRYDGLYACTALAEVELGRRAAVERRVLRNLSTNRLEPAAKALSSPLACREAFTPERWEEFKRDVEFFRRGNYPGSWSAIFLDHGYNASPAWTLVGSWPTNRRGASRTPGGLALIDPLLYLGMFSLLLWAFGAETCAVAALVWGLGYPWHYEWTGGAFARVPWLFLAVAAVCLLKRGWFGSAGFALAWSSLLQVFPAALLGGPALVAGRRLWVDRRVPFEQRRFMAGGLLAVVLVGSASLLVLGGTSAWADFVDNLRTDRRSQSANLMGLASALSWHPDRTLDRMKTGSLDDYSAWEESRHETLASRRVVYWLAAAGLLALVALFALEYVEAPWEAISAGTLVPVALLQLHSYYYVFLVLLVPLAVQRARRVTVLVLALVASQMLYLSGVALETLFALQSLLFAAVPAYVVADAVVTRRREAAKGRPRNVSRPSAPPRSRRRG